MKSVVSSDFNEINGFMSDFKSHTGFWGVSDPSVLHNHAIHKNTILIILFLYLISRYHR